VFLSAVLSATRLRSGIVSTQGAFCSGRPDRTRGCKLRDRGVAPGQHLSHDLHFAFVVLTVSGASCCLSCAFVSRIRRAPGSCEVLFKEGRSDRGNEGADCGRLAAAPRSKSRSVFTGSRDRRKSRGYPRACTESPCSIPGCLTMM
jgi:hypothetical protein